MIVHGFTVVTLARLLEKIIFKIKTSTHMRKIVKRVKCMLESGFKTFILENVCHFTATTILIIMSAKHPGHAILDFARGTD
jgi:hypothetical protein